MGDGLLGSCEETLAVDSTVVGGMVLLRSLLHFLLRMLHWIRWSWLILKGGVSILANDLGKGVLLAELGLGVGLTILWGGFRTEYFPFLSTMGGEFEYNMRVPY